MPFVQTPGEKDAAAEVTRAHRIAMAVSRDLQLATAAYELYVPTGQDVELINLVNRTGINAGFKVISEVLHQSAIMALCRVWDKGNEAQLETLKALVKKIEHPAVFEFYSAEDRGSVNRQRLNELKADVESARRTPEVQALFDLRHRRFAHTAAVHPEAKAALQAKYGDERRVLELTLPLATRAAAMVQCAFIPPDALRSIWRSETSQYWACVRDGTFSRPST